MPQSKQEINQRYREKNREKIKEINQRYTEKNREKIKEQSLAYYYRNKEEINKRRKEYSHEYNKKVQNLPKNIKSSRITKWKSRGILDEDLSAVYDYLIEQTNCMICLKEYKNSKDRHLDHDHQTGEIRYICCNTCNSIFLRDKYIS